MQCLLQLCMSATWFFRTRYKPSVQRQPPTKLTVNKWTPDATEALNGKWTDSYMTLFSSPGALEAAFQV